MGITVSVADIKITPQKIIQLEEGNVLHAMKRGEEGFVNFGEAYFSQIKMGAIKAWKKHLRMTLNLVVPIGEINFIFIDNFGQQRELTLGESNYSRITIPPNIWFGMQGIAGPFSLLMNIADIPHDPSEIERKNIKDILATWKVIK